MIKIIGIILLSTIAVIAVVAAIMQIIGSNACAQQGMLLILPFSDYDENVEMLLRDACRICENGSSNIEIIAVYCGLKNIGAEKCEVYDICTAFAREHTFIKCTTYSELNNIIDKEIKR